MVHVCASWRSRRFELSFTARKKAQSKDGRNQVQLGVAGVEVGRGWPRDVDSRLRNPVPDFDEAFAIEFGDPLHRTFERGTRRDGAEVLLDQLLGLRGIEVAGDD